MSHLFVTEIRRYPVKSCRGESVASAVVERQGLAGDRRYLVVDERNEAVTAREIPRMLLVLPQLTGDTLHLSAPDRAPIDVSLTAETGEVSVWRNEVAATFADGATNEWLSDYLGARVRLAFQHDPAARKPSARFAQADDRVSFADGYPLLITTEESLAALNDSIAAGPLAGQGPVPMVRFRPSVVIGGGIAWDEDGWRRLRIGAAELRLVKGCDRCVITTTDAETAARGKEPIATLARMRRWDGETWFGMNAIPDTVGVQISVGDSVEVLEAVPAPDGPPR